VGGAGMSEKFNHAIEKILSTALEEFPERVQEFFKVKYLTFGFE
jgi:hypothetical protein